jgi:glycosyltransferase involved in cell wall biosynthesis
VSTASFSPALYDTFAILTRPGARLSAGVRELLRDLEEHMRAVADEIDRSGRSGDPACRHAPVARLRRAASERALERFSWDACADRRLAAYEEVLSAGQATGRR